MNDSINKPELEWVGWVLSQNQSTKTSTTNISTYPIAVDFPGVMKLFSCGRKTAEVIAKESGAGFKIGDKRKLYIVSKLNDYVCKLADEQNKH